MPLFRPAQAPPAEPLHPSGGAVPSSEDDLISPEDLAEKRQRRRRWLTLLLLLLLGTGAGFAVKPVVHVAKAWQARRAAAEAERLTQEHKWLEAKIKVQDAIQLWRREPAAMRAAAIFLARVGNNRESIEFWKQVEIARPLTADEQREDAAALLATGEIAEADAHLRKAWPRDKEGTPSDWEIGMQIAARRNVAPDAAALAKRLIASPASTPRQRLNAAVTLLTAGGEPNARALALAQLQTLAQDQKSAESLDALLLLARWVGASAEGTRAAEPGQADSPTLRTLIERIEAHPLAKIQHQLLALDLRIAQDPARRDEWVQAAVRRFASAKDDADLAALGAWLYGKGEYQHVLDVIPAGRATDDRPLFFQRLDALGALNQWAEIRAAIQAHQVAVDPMIEEMYLARCADKLGEPQVRDARWDRAVDAAGANPEKLLQLGGYAEKNGQPTVAEKAFRAAVQAAPDSREAYRALLGLLESSGETRALREMLTTVLKLWPQDSAARNDAAYLDALLGENVRGALDAAQQLVKAEPLSLPHRITLALTELRLGHDLAALDVIRNINLSQTAMQPRQRAVLAAVLWATSYNREAQEALRGLSVEQLLPEERKLVQPIYDATVER